MKKIIPPTWRIQLRVWQRHLTDRCTGRWHQFATRQPYTVTADFRPQLELIQTLGSTATQHLEHKKQNLAIAIHTLQDVVILPGQIFSFWYLVDNPTIKAGYVEGRTITGDVLATSVGGGLCQLSGMIYFLALKAGLTMIERHPHSKDIYTDTTRFAPLGSDATVVYGYKDLQIQNCLATPICFQFCLTAQEIKASLCAPVAIAAVEVEFRSQALEQATRVDTWRYTQPDGVAELISSDIYPKLQVPTQLQ